MNKRRWNWLLWAGFVLCPVAILSYFLVFFRYPLTRDIPWVSYLIFAVAALCLLRGLRRAFGQPEQYRGKIAGPILSVLGVAAAGPVLLLHLSPVAAAPKIGRSAKGGFSCSGLHIARRRQPARFPRQPAF